MPYIDPFSSATKILAGLTAGRVTSEELTDLYSKGHTEAFAALSHRVAELTEEVKAAIAKK